MKRKIFTLALTLCFVFPVFAFVVPTVGGEDLQGNVLAVTNGSDSGSGSLRDVIANANDGDTVIFAPGVKTVTLTSGEISFKINNLTIDGGSGVTVTKAPSPAFRLLDCIAKTGTLTLNGLTFENGNYGSAVYIGNNTVITNCVFRNNIGGGLGLRSSLNNNVLTDCVFIGNTSQGVGGGMSIGQSTTTLTNCIF